MDIEGVVITAEGVMVADTTAEGDTDMICCDVKCPYCVRGHHCSLGETDELPCMVEDE